jgi:hypothetical protein
MKKLSIVLSLLGMVLALSLFTAPAQAQVILTNTTLSAAQGVSDSSIALTSTTGVTAYSGITPNTTTWLYVDRELELVTAINSSYVSVIRSYGSTAAHAHASGAMVFVVPAYLVNFSAGESGVGPAVDQGSCVRSNEPALPRIQFTSGLISDCVGGQWVNGDARQTTRATEYRLPIPNPGATNGGAALGTSTATVAAELYCTEIALPHSKLITGFGVHVGATGNGTDKWIYALYDAAGNLLANSAVAGTVVAGTNYAWAALPFTTPFYAVGPTQYYGCMMSNGTGDYVDLLKTGYQDNILTYKSAAAGTFGTLPSFTPPTSFTTLNGAYLYLY